MFRSKQYFSRYEDASIQLDTPLMPVIANGKIQDKSGYQFTINDRSSYLDWFNGFFEVKFSVNQLDGDGYAGTDIGVVTAAAVTTAGNIATMINGSTSLINNLNIKQNGKVVYEGNSVFLTTYVKSLIEYSGDYARSIASGEFFI